MSTEEVKKPVKVNKWDAAAVKNSLDDAVGNIIRDNFGYELHHQLMDIRLFISFVAVAFAGFALLWDWLNPFPKSRPVLIVCVLSYFALMGVLQLYMWFIEGKKFVVAVDRDPTGQMPDKKWTFSSTLKKYDPMYELEVKVDAGQQRGQAKLNKCIASWFDEEGKLVKEAFAADILKIHNSLMPDKKTK